MVKTDETRPVPRWAERHLGDAAAERIQAAVRAAEGTTSGEIVPMIVRESAAHGSVFPILLLTYVCAYFVLDVPARLNRLHGSHPAFVAAELLALAALAWATSLLDAVRRLVSHGADLDLQVQRRAIVEFHEAGLNKTVGGTGILLFVSLAERRAVVLVDKGIAALLPQTTWTKVVELLIKGTRGSDLGQGLVDAIGECGRLLAQPFPPRPDRANELADALIVKP